MKGCMFQIPLKKKKYRRPPGSDKTAQGDKSKHILNFGFFSCILARFLDKRLPPNIGY